MSRIHLSDDRVLQTQGRGGVPGAKTQPLYLPRAGGTTTSNF
jgi:hypothetical protein